MNCKVNDINLCAKTRVKGYFKEGIMETKENAEDIGFFLNNEENSLKTAKSMLRQFQEIQETF